MKIIKDYLVNLEGRYQDFYGKGRGKEEFFKSLKKASAFILLSFLLFLILLFLTKELLKAFIILFLLLFLIWKLFDSNIENKIKKRRNAYDLSMADFIERVALLLESGQPLWLAIERASFSKEEGSLESEILRAINEGRTMQDPCLAFSNLAKRSKSTSINSFTSLIVQNYRKGQSELVDLMRLQAAIYRNERKNTAKRLGDEATTLMLIPTTIVFIAILLMLLSPAFMSLSFLIDS